MENLDQSLERVFQEAFRVSLAEEEAAWLRFKEQLPEKQAWLVFSTALHQAQKRLQQATAWAHHALPGRV